MNELIQKAGSRKLALMLVSEQIDDINNIFRLFNLSTGTKQHYTDRLETLNKHKKQLS